LVAANASRRRWPRAAWRRARWAGTLAEPAHDLVVVDGVDHLGSARRCRGAVVPTISRNAPERARRLSAARHVGRLLLLAHSTKRSFTATTEVLQTFCPGPPGLGDIPERQSLALFGRRHPPALLLLVLGPALRTCLDPRHARAQGLETGRQLLIRAALARAPCSPCGPSRPASPGGTAAICFIILRISANCLSS